MLTDALKHLEWVLINRGYPKPIIKENINKIIGLSQGDVLHRNQQPNTNSTPRRLPIFSSPHGGQNKPIMKIIHSHWHLISNDPTLQQIFKSTPLLATKRHTSIRDNLVSAKTRL